MFIFRIKEVREKKNMTLYKLEKETGISRSYLHALENNKKAILPWLQCIKFLMH